MRPGKLRLPDSMATGRARSRRRAASTTAGGSGPELPMHVVQP